VICPHCHTDIPDRDLAHHLAAKGGRRVTPKTIERNRRAARVRWDRAKQAAKAVKPALP